MSPYLAARCAEIAYLDPEEGKAEAFGLGFSYALVAVGGSEAWLGCRGGESVIAFRGTEFSRLAWTDIVRNLMSGLRRWPGEGCVHDGYWRALAALLPLLESQLDGQRSLVLVGHSMGACLATLAGHLMAERVQEIHAFGSPRCGDRQFARSTNGRVRLWRYINRWDWLTFFPVVGAVVNGIFRARFYRHAGTAIRLGAGGHWIDDYMAQLDTAYGERKMSGEAAIDRTPAVW